MKKVFYIFIIIFLSFIKSPCWSQPLCYFEHYSTEDGLPQSTIMDMLQDRKGFMWFATWDGLCRFDGYTFSSYKVQSGDMYQIKNNRIDKIYEDKYGYIWIQAYNNEAHRFDPRTEQFTGLYSSQETADRTFLLSKIKVNPSGKTWLLSDQDGCICIPDSSFNPRAYTIEKDNLKGNSVYSVFEDKELNSWILTNNGICMVPANGTRPLYYFTDNLQRKANEEQSFYSAMEVGESIWFGSGKGRIWRYLKKNGTFEILELGVLSRIVEIKILQKEKIIISTSNDGFFIYNISTEKMEKYDRSNLPEMKSNHILSTYIDRKGNLWLEMDCMGVARFDMNTRKLKHFEITLEDAAAKVFHPLFLIFEDKENRLWVHPRGGGFSLYNELYDHLDSFYNAPGAPDWKFSNILHSAFCDKQGNLWMCTRSNGLEKIHFDTDIFRHHLVDLNTKSATNNDVRAVFEDGRQRIWVATKDAKLRIYNKDREFQGYFCENGSIGDGKLFEGVVYCMAEYPEGTIWIGTRGSGLYRAEMKEDTNKYILKQFARDPNDIYSLSFDAIYSILPDNNGRIWVGTFGGGLNLIEQGSGGGIRFINYRNNLKNYPIDQCHKVRYIMQGKNSHIYVGTTMGMIAFSSDFSTPENVNYQYYTRVPGEKESLSNNDVHNICQTSAGELYIATFGGGMNKVEKWDAQGFPEKFRSYNIADGLPSDVVLSIIEDENQKLWISTENNLTKFNPESHVFETYGAIKRLMKMNYFSEASTCRLLSNEIIFGSSQGLLTFFPDKVKSNHYKPYIAFERFRLFNKIVPVKDNSLLQTSIDNVKQLILSHKQNFFSIEYSALDFIEPANILYAYKLEGFDQDWIYVQKQRIANYTNLPKGEYVFKVKSTNTDGFWVDNERSLPIKIKPSFWETPLAYFLYVLVFFIFVFLSVYILFTFYKLKNNIQVEKKMSEMKLSFFTDISHEIRTPLTMIAAPLEYLINNSETSEFVKKQLELMSHNTNRMLRLANQIMDFRKIQQLKLRIEETEIAPFLEDISVNFQEMAEKQHIHFQFINHAPDTKLWIDKDCMEKIIFNLLSNAFKNTSQGKSIQLILTKKDKLVLVAVQDEGNGIPKERQKKLFNRFTSFNEDKSKPSTGIGLSIVKDLVEKHHARVIVESEINKGSCFTVVFQSGFAHFEKDVEIIASGSKIAEISESITDLPEIKETRSEEVNSNKRDSRSTVLVVEDDDDLRGFLKTILSKDYKLIEAADGKTGLKKALEIVPDFIVSDIMMPEMDGVELLQCLKGNINTSHIPVVLLTAKTTIESKLEGLSYGADDYITKPFSVPYFQARIENLLHQRQNLQQIYSSRLLSPQVQTVQDTSLISSQDELLMEKIVSEIEKNLENNDFSVENLGISVGLSRSVFFNKIKGLTGLSPIEFIRDVRLKKAANLLINTDILIKEISFMVGISDIKYFSKCFKEKYGMTPSEYRGSSTKT